MTEIDVSKPRAIYQPGELDRTRQNLGDIDPSEIKDLTRLLGGEIGVEKAPVGEDAFGSVQQTHRKPEATMGTTAPLVRAPASSTSNIIEGGLVNKVGKRGLAENSLPVISPKERIRMDRLMMSDAYRIKANFGFFNFFVFLNKNRADKVTSSFVSKILSNYISHMLSFNQNLIGLLDNVPDTYKQHIHHDGELKPKFLRLCAAWDFTAVNKQYEGLQKSGNAINTSALVPIIRNLYQMLLPIYFLGSDKCSALIESVAVDLAKYADIDKAGLAPYIRKAATEGEYIFEHCIRGMYPLLLRMCSNKFSEYAPFFTTEIGRILKFLRMTKYDLLLPEKRANSDSQENAAEGAEGGEDEADDAAKGDDGTKGENARGEEKTADQDVSKAEKDQNFSATGLKLLNRLFPDTGWLKLNSCPDFFPFFQPIFKISEGFGLLAPENPVQKVLVFLRILGDLFHGCRHIKFDFSDETVFSLGKKTDTLDEIMDDWDVYEDVLFAKNYAENLKNLVNQQQGQPGFLHTPLGKKIIYGLLWQAKNYYLPHYTIKVMGKNSNDLAYKPLFLRVVYLKHIFSTLADHIDRAAENRDAVPGIDNPWEPYRFDIANAVSKRLDMINKVQGNSVMSTNGGLIKYMAAIISAFDWWINDAQSTAYADPNAPIYRISPEDGSPAYPPPLRDDQYRLFKKELEKMVAAAGHIIGAGEEKNI